MAGRRVRGGIGMMRLVALVSLVFLAACPAADRDADGPGAADSAAADLALPPSAGASRGSLPDGVSGGSPDTLRPAAPAETGRRMDAADLEVDSIVATYRDHYRSEYIELHDPQPADRDLAFDPEVVESTERRTSLQFGYVELGGWDRLLADLSEGQRAELVRRIDAFHEELGM